VGAVGSFLSKAIGFIIQGVTSFINLIPSPATFSKWLETALGQFCKKEAARIIEQVKIKKVDDEICSRSDAFTIETGIKAVISSSLKWLFKQATLALHTYVWMPLTGMIMKLVNQGIAALGQLIDGLCGLVPAGGGPICMLITVPLGTLMSWVLQKLGTRTLENLVKSVEEYVQGQLVDPLVDAVTNVAVDSLMHGTLPKIPSPKTMIESLFQSKHEMHEKAEASGDLFFLGGLHSDLQALHRETEHKVLTEAFERAGMEYTPPDAPKEEGGGGVKTGGGGVKTGGGGVKVGVNNNNNDDDDDDDSTEVDADGYTRMAQEATTRLEQSGRDGGSE
jgi:hypothetical protein